uniref:Uncharacterized protein n=1 Tax=Anguilla anguilla TaxID=7936 RepID=A0A0E9P5P1_ANGAN
MYHLSLFYDVIADSKMNSHVRRHIFSAQIQPNGSKLIGQRSPHSRTMTLNIMPM